jgi:branched-chain amino acid transport system ATP-binding protein
MLELRGVTVKYGNALAIQDISFVAQDGARIALLGANGAGKSTVANAISGMVPLAGGEIRFDGRPINGLPPHIIVALGVSQIPEGRLVFPKMTVWENLELGATPLANKREKPKVLEQVYELFPRLRERAKQTAGTLSGGEQQMLAVGRALMSRPKLILSDEISMGLAPVVVRTIYENLLKINAEWGVTLLIVEQDAKLALKVASHCHILESGRIVAGGSSVEMARSEIVRRVYLAEMLKE